MDPVLPAELTTRAGPSETVFGSDIAADVLHALGLRYLPLTPGASFRGLHDSVVNHLGNAAPQVILCLHELVAVGVAHGYAKAMQRVAAVALHNLVGLMNAQMGIYNLSIDRAPVMILGGGGPRDPSSRRPIEWAHSAMTQGELVRPFVKHDEEPFSGQELAEALARCHREAASGPHGPTYITLDVDLQESAVGNPVDLSDVALLARPTNPLVPDPDLVDRAAALLRGADLPVIVAGRTGLVPQATDLLVGLGETLGAACVDERQFVTFPTDHALNLSVDRSVIAESDVVFAVDSTDLRAVLGARRRPGQRLVTCGLDALVGRSWGNHGRAEPPADVEIVADPLLTVQRLLDALRVAPPPRVDRDTRSRRLADRRAHSLAQRPRVSGGSAITPVALVEELWEAVAPHPWLLAERNGRSWPEGIWRFTGSGQFLGHSSGGGVGYGPGSAVGGALAAAERGQFAVAILGDGDLNMTPAALWTAAHYRLPLLVVVNNNRSFLNDEEHQERIARIRGRPVENAWVGTRIDDPPVDFSTVARGFGLWGSGPVERRAELAAALRAAVDHVVDRGTPALVDVVTQRPSS